MKMKKLLTVLLSTALLAGLTACAGGAEKVDKKASDSFAGTPEKDTVVLDITTEPAGINPLTVGEVVSQVVLNHCMSGLTRLDKNDEPVADLAEKWEINEDSTMYTMHLRKDAKWSNGDPVTAKDFYFSWVTQMKEETAAPLSPHLYMNIKNGEDFYNKKVDESQLGLKVVDDNTLQIEWARPMLSGLFLFTLPPFFPVNEKVYKEIGEEEYGKDADKMVTNGAFNLTTWKHDDHIMMEKSEDYWNADQINIPKMKLVMIGDANTRVNAFMAGEIDLINVYSEQIAQLEKKGKNAIESYIDGGSWYLNFNKKDEYMSNANLRKALAYSVDVQSLLDNVINDGSVAADGFVPGVIGGAGGESYSKARGSLFAYDKDAAVKYLEKALEELGKDVSELNLTFSATDTTYNQNQAAYIQQQWKDNLGLEVEIDVKAWKALSEAKSNGDYQVCVDGAGPTENDAKTFLETLMTEDPANTGKYSNPEYDQLMRDVSVESDPQKRQDLMIEAEKLAIEDMAVGPMYFTCTTYAVSDKLEGLVRTPFQLFNVCDGAKITAQ